MLTVCLRSAARIDWMNDRFGQVATWLVLLATLISAANATSRYLFSASSNAWLEIQWYMFAGMVLLGAPYVLKINEHVRVDLIYSIGVGAGAPLDRPARRHLLPAADLHRS